METSMGRQGSRRVQWRWLEAALLFGLAFWIGQVVFCGWEHDLLGRHSRGFWAFPFVFWAALRFGAKGTLLILLMFLTQSLWGALHGLGYFAKDLSDTRLLNLSLYNASLFLLGMALAIAKKERNVLFQAVDSGPNEMLLFSADTLRFSYASHGALSNLGFTRAEMKRMTPLDVCPEFSEQTFHQLLQPLLEHRQPMLHFRSLHRRRDGTRYPIEVHMRLHEQTGKRYFLAMILDISGRQETEDRLHSILETAHAIIWAVDENAKFIFLSLKIKDILGVEASALKGLGLFDMLDGGMIHEDDMEAHRRAYDALMECGEPICELVHRARHADGSWRWLSVSATPVYDANHRLTQIVGVVHDVHAQKMAEQRLRQINQDLDREIQAAVRKVQEKDLLLQEQSRLASMGELIGNIAHQWRQPLNSLSLMLSDLADAYTHNECDERYMRTTVAQTNAIIQKMSGTIDDFINFSRPDRQSENIFLMRETATCLRLISATLEHYRIQVVVDCPQEVVAWGYPNEFTQAMLNLLTNAKDAILASKVEEGMIRIEIGQNGDMAELRISDNGGGIAAVDMPHIFEPFFTTKPQGVGIGLYISRTAIERNMQGRLEVRNVGCGAEFTIGLPMTQVRYGGVDE